MFTVDVDNKTYKVFFRYGSDKPVHARKNKRYTECVISEKLGEKEYKETSSYKEYCSPKDNFCKNRGRKLALVNLLNKLKFPKEVRVLFWEEYFKARGFKTKYINKFYEDAGEYYEYYEEILVPNY